MFKHLTDLGYKRNKKEAFGFYVAYFILTILTAGLLGGVFSIIIAKDIVDSLDIGMRVGTIVAIIISTGASFFVLKEKKLLGNFGFILLVILSGVLAIFTGAIGGLIPTAFLTTRK